MLLQPLRNKCTAPLQSLVHTAFTAACKELLSIDNTLYRGSLRNCACDLLVLNIEG
jgi:hypothetical protein